MKPTTGLALAAATLTNAAAAPAAAKDQPRASAAPDLAKMLHIDFLRDRGPEGGTGNGKGNNGNGRGNDGDHIPNGHAWGWWKNHPRPVSP